MQTSERGERPSLQASFRERAHTRLEFTKLEQRMFIAKSVRSYSFARSLAFSLSLSLSLACAVTAKWIRPTVCGEVRPLRVYLSYVHQDADNILYNSPEELVKSVTPSQSEIENC